MRHVALAAAVSSFVLFAVPSRATARPPQAAAPTLVLRGGRLFDPASATTRPNGQLWIAGERILGDHPADTPPPAGARVVDVGDATLLPGLFDLHVHVAVPGATASGELMLPAEENLATHLAFGVTHVLDLHHAPEVVFPLRDRTRVEPGLARLSAVGAAFTVPGGHPTQIGLPCNTVTSLDEVGRRMGELLPWQPDAVKAVLEHGAWATLPRMPSLDEATLTEIARQAHAAGRPLFVHVWTLDEAKTATRAGADVLAHGVFVGSVDDELIALMREHRTAYVPTLAVVVGPNRIANGRSPYSPAALAGQLHPDLEHVLNEPASGWASTWKEFDEARFLANLMKLKQAGIRCGTGTDAGNPQTPHGPALLFEVALYVEAGMTPGEALACATLESARILRVDGDAGTLDAGKLADVVVVKGDPTRDLAALSSIEHVFKGGVEFDRAARRTLNAGRAAPPVTTKVAPGTVLDDFEDGDLACPLGGTWSAAADGLGGANGKSTAQAEAAEASDTGVLHVDGALVEGYPFGLFAGITLAFDAQGKRLVDVGACKELVLRARGTARTFQLALDRAAVRDYDSFMTTVTLQDEWQELRLPLASFHQQGFGRKVDVAWNDLKGLRLEARLPPGVKRDLGEFEFEVDSIRFE